MSGVRGCQNARQRSLVKNLARTSSGVANIGSGIRAPACVAPLSRLVYRPALP